MMQRLCFLALWWCLCSSLFAGQLERVSAEPVFDSLRLTLEVSSPTQFRYSLLESPDRLFVELTDTEAAAGFSPSVQSPPVSLLRFSRKEKNLRLVFELSSSVLVKAYRLKAGNNRPERIVLELAGFKPASLKTGNKPAQNAVAEALDDKPSPRTDATEPEKNAQHADINGQPGVLVEKEPSADKEPLAGKKSSAGKEPSANKEPLVAKQPSAQKPTSSNEPSAKNTAAPKGKTSRPAEPKVAVPSPALYPDPMKEVSTEPKPRQESHAPIRGRKIIIALDAGHGGKDTGAVGARGIREKDVVLAITRELASQLNQDGRFKVALTRSGDEFIPLKGRRDKARKLKADVFVSIHADAFVNAQARGASVFALSQRGATSEMARFLAESENSSDLLGSVGGVSLDDKDEVLAGVLVDLSMTATLANSLDLGGRVLKELGRMADLHNHSVEQAGFVVLKSPDVPSILVETGFISNPAEAMALNSPAYRQKIARAIFNGLNSYFATQGPEMAPQRQSSSAPDVDAPAEPQAKSNETSRPLNVHPDTPKIDPRAESRASKPAVSTSGTPSKAGSNISSQTKSAPAAKAQNHKVVQGDSLEKIARKYGVSQKVIVQANGMPNTTVKIGQTLIIPVP